MTVQEIAERLVSLCKTAAFTQAQTELFSEDATSTEPHTTPMFDKVTKGREAIIEKGKKWDDMVVESHAIEVSEPLVAGSSFACTMRMDVTMKEGGRMDMTELCVYVVKDGKIVSEEFFT